MREFVIEKVEYVGGSVVYEVRGVLFADQTVLLTTRETLEAARIAKLQLENQVVRKREIVE